MAIAPTELVGSVRRWIGEVEELRQENEKLKATGQPERNLLIGVEETDAETIMEAGLIIPRPGERDAWMAANAAALGELAQTPRKPVGRALAQKVNMLERAPQRRARHAN